MLNRILTSRWLQFFVLLVLLIVIALAATDKNRVTETLRNYAFDQFNRWDEREPTDQVIIVDIDENSLKEIGQWPWPRDIIAELVLNLKAMGAKVIAFDMVFAEPDRMSPSRFAKGLVKKGLIDEETQAKLANLPDNDEILAAAFKEAGNVVTGFTYARPEETRGYPAGIKDIKIKKKNALTVINNFQVYEGVSINHQPITKYAAGNGTFIAKADHDGIIRRYTPLIIFKDDENIRYIYPSLGTEALRVANNKKEFLKLVTTKNENIFSSKDFLLKIGLSNIEIPIKKNGQFYLKYRKLTSGKDYILAKDIINNRNQIQNKISDKIVLIGTSAEGLRDIRNTSIQAFVPGVEVHFNFIEQVLQNDFLFRDGIVSIETEKYTIFICGIIIIALSLFFGVFPLLISTSIMIGSIGYGCFYLYTDHGLLFDPINTSLSIFIIFVLATLLNYLRTEITAREIRGAFGLYISPDFMEELTEHPEKLQLGGEMRDLTIMFTDIRNFTTISESMSPEALINTMNDFLTPMSDVVMNTRGTIDKYMGDAMMAFWNAPLDDADHAKHAIDAALSMKKSLEPVNEALRIQAEKDGVEPLQLAAGIGVNTGKCAVGNMGSKQRFAYSALGDAVNLASRLEGQTKAYGLDLLVGEKTIPHIADYAIMDIDLIQVKGKTQPVQIFTILGNEDVAQTSDYQNFIKDHNAFINHYRDGDFATAEQMIKQARSHNIAAPYHAYYDIMMGRVLGYKKTPPENWNGVFVATSK